MKILSSPSVPSGQWWLVRDHQVVLVVKAGAPIEDAVCDMILVPPDSYVAQRLGVLTLTEDIRARIYGTSKPFLTPRPSR